MPLSDASMQFSLFYWGNDDGVGRDKYRLLLEGARFADDNGFVAVWTPERHFHAFGGPYPNPSVTGAAVPGHAEYRRARGGCVVAPLHHPARIAEEWAVIDNLTGGRAGMAIASGWQPDDFILRPENTPPDEQARDGGDHRCAAPRSGGAKLSAFPGKDGEMHAVVTQPRPVSPELPVWITTAGNPETWKEAGARLQRADPSSGPVHRRGGRKDRPLPRRAARGGHDPDAFTVTLMLHTFLSDSRAHARGIARAPMKDYLNAAAGLIKQYAWVFPGVQAARGRETPSI